MKNLISLFVIMILSLSGLKAQVVEVEIKTSGQCEHCKETIEKNIRFEKGVKKVVFNPENHIATIKYDASKNSLENIRIAITKLGYDADSLHADPKAYEKLNACCKKKE